MQRWVLGLGGVWAMAQTLSNWGERIRTMPGTLVSVVGSVTNRQGGSWYHSGALYVTDTLDNRAGNEMFRATFPDNRPVSPGKVQLRGGYQWITGTDPIHFDTLELRGTSSKNLALAAYVRYWLDLGDHMLNTHAFVLYHQNPDPASVVRGEGFVRSALGGALARYCHMGERYLYPVGDSLPILRYRPVYITPTQTGLYPVRFAAVDATSEGYDRNRRPPSFCLINPDFFHHVGGPAGGVLEIAFDPTQDGAYDATAHWRGTRWDSVGGTIQNGTPLAFLVQSVASFSPTPFALAVYQPHAQIVVRGDTALCPGDSVQLTVEPYNPNWTYVWNTGSTGPTLWVRTPGTYFVTVRAGLGCQYTSASVTIRGLPAPSISLRPPSPQGICPGQSLRLVASPAQSYRWFYEGQLIPGATDSVLVVSQPGQYVVEGLQVCGWARSEPFVLSHYPEPRAFFTTQPPDTVELGQLITFIDASQGGTPLQWIIGGQSFPGSPTITQAFGRDSTYLVTLIVQNEYGCRDTFSRLIYVRPFSGIFIPTAFSPNGDGINDEFLIVSPPLEWSRLRIYSRWGHLIREIVGYPLRWDGRTQNGEPAPEDAYAFVFEGRLFSGQTFQRTGTITLLR
ncbi:MAG: gliding motility-associated C-terminal domain-containing protein [Bacteroidia bacterium]